MTPADRSDAAESTAPELPDQAAPAPSEPPAVKALESAAQPEPGSELESDPVPEPESVPESEAEPEPEPEPEPALADAAGTDQAADESADESADQAAEDAPVLPSALADLLSGLGEDDGIDDEAEDGGGWLEAATQPMVEEGDDELRRRILSNIEGMEGEDDILPSVIDLPPAEIRGAVEAILLVATKPLTMDRLQRCLPGASADYLLGLLQGLADRFTVEGRGWDLRAIGHGWQLLTRASLHPWVRQLDKRELPTRLSRSAMETLAIVAYRQPVTRGDIEDVRGVQCGPMLRQLMDLKLVQVLGRNDDAVGRPLLYGTTEVFLDRFGLANLGDLPRRHEFGE